MDNLDDSEKRDLILDFLFGIATKSPTQHTSFFEGISNLAPQDRLKAAKPFYCSFSEEIEAAVEPWHIEQPLPKLEGEAQVFLENRAVTAANFVLSVLSPHKIDDNPFCFSPGCSPETTIKYLLTEWWNIHGWQEAFLCDSALGGLSRG